ncbi:MAG: elongation factor G [Planctomycetes bacterium]|nr:elongation factor G [Planctomycetota bacterium]MBI3846830.1 elongation factor G [Planctomycetota bacterium]
MAAYETKDIRNVAFVGHGHAGKTTLIEAMLFKAGATKRLGHVEDGTSILDFEPEEKERKSSIDSAIAHCSFGGAEINLVDTPGYPDFIGQVIGALRAVETAVVCVNAAAGIAVNTRKTWELAGREGLSRAILITHADGENVKLDEVLTNVIETFGPQCVPAFVPVGEGPTYKGAVSVLAPTGPLAQAAGDAVAEANERFLETAVEVDDALLEKYLEGQKPSPDDVKRVTALAIARGKIVPVLYAAAPKDLGAEDCLSFVASYFPSPIAGVRRHAAPAADGAPGPEIDPNPAAPLAAQVFKTTWDPIAGKETFVRIFAGTLVSDSSFFNHRTGKPERFGHLLRPMGKDTAPIPKGIPGDIVAIGKVESLHIADTLADEKHPVKVEGLKYPTPMVSFAVEPKKRGDEQKIGTAMSKLTDEDPSFQVRRDAQTKEMVMSGVSNLQLDIFMHRIKRRNDVEVVSHPPRIPYLETITATGDARYRHKKQTGGAGQFAEVALKIEPLERGKGFEFANEIFGGAISQSYVASTEKGVRQVLEKGAIAGYPVVDIKAIVYDGKEHPVDSKDIAFQVAGRNAFKEAMRTARPVLLEPVVIIEINVPSKFMGDITSDLNGRRGRIIGMDTQGNHQIIKAQVPHSEVMTYSTELRSLTGGEGSYSMEFSHYDVVPSRIAEGIISRAKAALGEEKEDE